MMEIHGTIHFKLILPHFPGFQQEPLPEPVCSRSPECKDCPYKGFFRMEEVLSGSQSSHMVMGGLSR